MQQLPDIEKTDSKEELSCWNGQITLVGEKYV